MDKRIWVLGSSHANADKSISWLSTFPNFSNSDMLIVNLCSLEEAQYTAKYAELDKFARRYIFDMLMTGEKEVIVILSPEHHLADWLPIIPQIKSTAPVELDKYKGTPYLNAYLKAVEECSFYIHDVDTNYFKAMTDPKSPIHENYSFTEDARERYFLDILSDYVIMNKAKQVVACVIRVEIQYGIPRKDFLSGLLWFLPPPTAISAERAIDLIINALIGGELKETPPEWDGKMVLPNLLETEDKIREIEQRKEELARQIEKLQTEKEDKIKFRRLLWTKDVPLENVVKDAFVFLGFDEIGKRREPNLEDWVIKFRLVPEFEFGVFEIKGSDKRTALSDLTQCNKWVEDYILENKKAKGIFVPNQYRLEDLRTSQTKREHFERNELEYAEKRDVCILPSHEIFNVVSEKMRGNPQITRKFIEEKIASSKGLCKLH